MWTLTIRNESILTIFHIVRHVMTFMLTIMVICHLFLIKHFLQVILYSSS